MPRVLWIVAGVLAFFGILFAWHYFLYFSSVHFFGIAGKGGRRAVAGLFLLLPASFFASAWVGRRMEGSFARGFYTASTLWIGVGLALMLFFALAWAAWGILRLHNPRPSLALFGAAAFLATCLYSAYGIWNACHPRVKEIAVGMQGLSRVWQGRRLVQITDLHLGLSLGVAFLDGVVRQVNAQKPAAVFITGDLFDGGDLSLDRFVAPLSRIQAPLGVYFVTGNHETYLGIERALAVLRRAGVRVLDDEMVSVDGLQIVGVSYPRAGFSKDIGAAIRRMPGFDPEKSSILLYHSPSQIPEVKAAGIRFQVAGHTHHGQMIPIQLITRMIYGKYYRGLHVEGEFAIYTSAGTGAWGPLMRTGNVPEITVIRLEPM